MQEEFQQKSPDLIEVLKNLWATSNTDVGGIKSIKPVHIQIDMAKLLPKLPQCPLKPETVQGLTPCHIAKDLIMLRLVISLPAPATRRSSQYS